MNPEDNNLEKPLSHELEARIVAWIAGQASAFEASEVERLLAEQPELALFKRRMEAVQGLVIEAVRPDKKPLQLAPERREALLTTLGAKPDMKTDNEAAKKVVLMPKRSEFWFNRYRLYISIAACLVMGLIAVLSVPGFGWRRSKAFEAVALSDPNLERELEPPGTASFSVTEPVENAKKKVVEDRFALAEKQKVGFDLKAREEKRSDSIAYFGAVGGKTPQRPTPDQTPTAPASAPVPVGQGLVMRDAATADAQKQASAGNSDDYGEVIKMEPFEVTTDKVKGYMASNSIGGTRMATPLKDVGSAISVVSNDLAKDLNASNSSDLLAYTSNTEVGGAKGDFGAAASNAPAAPAPTDSSPTVTGAGENPEGGKEEVVELSPFSVMSENEKKPVAKAKKIPSGPMPPVVKDKDDFGEIAAVKNAVSTFSLHVSDVSFQLVKDALNKGSNIRPEQIRPEEFYNAFNYRDPAPSLGEKVSCRIEQARHPFLQQRNLLRIAMRVAGSGRGASQPLHLTVLLDTSGSMEREDRVDAVRGAMKSLISLLGPNDSVTLIGFARQPHLLAEAVPGDHGADLLKIVENTPPEGGTNLEEALKLGRAQAQRHFDSAAQNRIVLLTDGAANLGDANREHLAAEIEQLRENGIALDACGVGTEGLDDAMLEALTRKSDGRYYILNSAADAGEKFARQLAGAFRPAAKNVKVQVRFNPARVGSYRLIGFEQHRLNEEDFRNDKVDAAELAAEEAAVAVYQVEPLPQGEGELGEVFVRFLDPATGSMVEQSWSLPYDAKASAFDRATPTMQLAGTAALLAEALRRDNEEEAVRLNELVPVVNGLRSAFPKEQRVQDLISMYATLRKLLSEKQ